MTSADKFGIAFAIGFTAVMIGLVSGGTFETSQPSPVQSTPVETYSPPPPPRSYQIHQLYNLKDYLMYLLYGVIQHRQELLQYFETGGPDLGPISKALLLPAF